MHAHTHVSFAQSKAKCYSIIHTHIIVLNDNSGIKVHYTFTYNYKSIQQIVQFIKLSYVRKELKFAEPLF